MIVADAGYKTPAIARLLIEDGIEPLFPYKRPMTKAGFFRKQEYAYDEYHDCYICPQNKVLTYRTTNRDGYREYKSYHCENCPCLDQCTRSKDQVKLITRHIWEDYIEKSEDIRYRIGSREIYALRKETIERIFAMAKEQHGFRYTQYKGKAQMQVKAALTFACINLKKLARILSIRQDSQKNISSIFQKYRQDRKMPMERGSMGNFVYSLRFCEISHRIFFRFQIKF